MRKNLSLTLMLSALALAACSKESPELLPCMCDGGSDSTLGLFDCMCEPAKKKPVRRISYLQDKQKIRYQTLIIDDAHYDAYTLLHQSRDSYAPIKLENVDFRIKKSRKYDDFDTKLGNYRFRIFGCRRESKNAFLNQGRTLQKDMHFFDVFYETMNDFYPVVVEQNSVYYPDSDKRQAEYVITAEITDYFMNICDEFDWEEAKNKKLRSGSSEMTVTWRVMNLKKDHVYCRGTTTGYGQIMEGEPNGETLLAERAFEDALVKIPEISCLNDTLSRRVYQSDIDSQLVQISEDEYCASCFNTQYAAEIKGIEALQECEHGTHNHRRGKNKTFTPISHEECRRVPVESEGGVRYQYLTIDGEECDPDMFETTGSTRSRHSFTPGEECRRVPVESEGGVRYQYLTIDGEECDPDMIESEGGVAGSHFEVSEDCQTIEIPEEECILETPEEIKLTDDYFVDIPLEIDTLKEAQVTEDGGSTGFGSNIEINTVGESAFASIDNQFCIQNNPPFENLKPENLYKLRASIVSVENASGKKGAGLIIADNLVLTSADLIQKDNNAYDLKTINGKSFKASAFRVNPTKNVAVLLLDKPTAYQPLPMSLTLPEVNQDILLTLGLLNFDEDGENYIDNEGRVIGYRWSEDRGAEIIVDTFVQTVTLGGALIDQKGNIIGIAHETKKTDTSPDLFIPIETALKSLGLEICGQAPVVEKPKPVRVYTPIADAIDNSKADTSPKPVEALKRK